MKNKLLKGDYIIISFVIILAVAIVVFMLPKDYEKNVLEIYLNGELINSLDLNDEIHEKIEIDELAHNTIEIDGKRVRIVNSTCFDHVCENTGYISKSGEVIVCMPNKLLLKIVGDDSKREYDAVVG